MVTSFFLSFFLSFLFWLVCYKYTFHGIFIIYIKFSVFLFTIFRSWSVVEFEQSTHTDLPVSVSSSFPHIDFGSRSSVEGRLPGLDRPSHAVAVCQLCHSIFWRVSIYCCVRDTERQTSMNLK